MATRTVSPGGSLLRASRIFAVAAPLPKPVEGFASGSGFQSDSATLPYPIHQTITTPQAARARGDWGFKRPLPLRSTNKTSTPFIKVQAIDTYEHITDFRSSADHTISLQKWLEMGVPLTIAKPGYTGRTGEAQRISVFEEMLDTTTDAEHGTVGNIDTRWKFNGPWLAGQSEGEFLQYLRGEIRRRKGDFQKYLRKACADELTKKLRQDADGETRAAVEVEDVTDHEMTAFVKNLRDGRADLFQHLRVFLDLPPSSASGTEEVEETISDLLNSTNKTMKGTDFMVTTSPYAKYGPPKTHPSAGLSYIRTDARIFNHPEFGPQKDAAPIPARVVMPKKASTGNFQATFGVGGFVTEIPVNVRSSFSSHGSSRGYDKTPAVNFEYVDPEKVGGSKTHVKPKLASINSKGKVVLQVDMASESAISILEGKTAELAKRKTPVGPQGLERRVPLDNAPLTRGYGLMSDDFAPSPAPRRNADDAMASLSQLF